MSIANEAALVMIDILKEPRKNHLLIMPYRGDPIAVEEDTCGQVDDDLH